MPTSIEDALEPKLPDDLNEMKSGFREEAERPAFGDDFVPLKSEHPRGEVKRRKEEVEIVSKDQLAKQRQSIEAAKTLPIAAHRKEILEKLERNRVLIISGDTGCGKTTQVPKYILEQAKARG